MTRSVQPEYTRAHTLPSKLYEQVGENEKALVNSGPRISKTARIAVEADCNAGNPLRHRSDANQLPDGELIPMMVEIVIESHLVLAGESIAHGHHLSRSERLK